MSDEDDLMIPNDVMERLESFRAQPGYKPTDVAKPWWNKHGQYVEYSIADEAYCTEYIGGCLTLCRSIVDNRIIGCQLSIDEQVWDAERYQTEEG